MADDKRTATYGAIGNDCRVLTLDREDFVALLGSVEDLVQHGTNEEVEVVEQEDRVALDVTLNIWTTENAWTWGLREGTTRHGP